MKSCLEAVRPGDRLHFVYRPGSPFDSGEGVHTRVVRRLILDQGQLLGFICCGGSQLYVESGAYRYVGVDREYASNLPDWVYGDDEDPL